jgi:hypothetical protein
MQASQRSKQSQGEQPPMYAAVVAGRWVRFSRLEHIPAEAVGSMFSTEDELSPDRAYELYAKMGGVHSKVQFSEMPAELLRGRMELLPDGLREPESKPKKRREYTRHSKLVFSFSKPTEVALKVLAKSPGQMLACWQIATKDGSAVPLQLTELEAKALFESNEARAKLRTKQSGYRVFQYYRSNLIALDLLRVN